jgi:tRNA A-37 threonylcarbamoyl transferase component Bud32
MNDITDFVSDPVFPLFWHFSTKGIVPRVISAEPDIVTLEYAKGPRLGQYMHQAPQDRLLQIYTTLGTNVAYINKYCVQHGHLHTENIVVSGGNPVIIDWDHGSFLGIPDIEFWKGQDSQLLLKTTKERLHESKKGDFYAAIENAYTAAFEKEFRIPRQQNHREISIAATEKFGF